METTELLKRVRRIEIKTRGLTQQIFAGEYHSAFKGKGMTFSEVREYQYGDDIRNIDWNVTARFNHPFIKTYEEERELTVKNQSSSDRITLYVLPSSLYSQVFFPVDLYVLFNSVKTSLIFE